MAATPKMIAAAWATWHSRHGGKLGPGPAFVEAINAAIEAMDKPSSTEVEEDRCEHFWHAVPERHDKPHGNFVSECTKCGIRPRFVTAKG